MRVIHADMVADAHRVISPGAILLDGPRIVKVGSPQSVGTVAHASLESRPEELILPGLINAHVHLDLTSLGPISCDEGFSKWLECIRAGRETTDEGISNSVCRGVSASLAGGTVGVGDIGGAYSWVPVETLQDHPLLGFCAIEVFGTGLRQQVGLEAIRSIIERCRSWPQRTDRVRPALSPHAPHSCDRSVFAAAAASGLPLATHLAETLEELRFCRDGDGPLRDLLMAAGVWSEEIEPLGNHPLDAMDDLLAQGTWTIAHVNYPSSHQESAALRAARIARLAEHDVSVAYCPRASRFFGHPAESQAGHPWRELLEAGVPVALGTDGMPCLDTPDRLSILDEMRCLADEDSASFEELIGMATIHGARAVGIDPGLVGLDPGPIAGLISIPAVDRDPLRSIRAFRGRPQWVQAPEGVAVEKP